MVDGDLVKRRRRVLCRGGSQASYVSTDAAVGRRIWLAVPVCRASCPRLCNLEQPETLQGY